MSMSMERLEEALAQEEATNVQLRARIAELEAQQELTNIERHERNLQKFLAEQPAQQEPFGYFRYDLRLDAWVQNRAGLTGTPFYTSPPAQQNIRNATLDEIATKIAAMPFGDTAASFAVWIREQKT